MSKYYQVEVNAHELRRGDLIRELPASAGGDIQEMEGILGEDYIMVQDMEISLSAKFITAELQSVMGSAQGQSWSITLPALAGVTVGRLA